MGVCCSSESEGDNVRSNSGRPKPVHPKANKYVVNNSAQTVENNKSCVKTASIQTHTAAATSEDGKSDLLSDKINSQPPTKVSHRTTGIHKAMESDFVELGGGGEINTRPKKHNHAVNMEVVSEDEKIDQPSKDSYSLSAEKEKISNVALREVKDRTENVHYNEKGTNEEPGEFNGDQSKKTEKYNELNNQEEFSRKRASNSEGKSSTKNNLPEMSNEITTTVKEANNNFRNLSRKLGGINTLSPIDENHDPAAKNIRHSDEDSSSGEESGGSMSSGLERCIDSYGAHKEKVQSDHRYSQTLKTSAEIDQLHAVAADLPMCRQNYEIK